MLKTGILNPALNHLLSRIRHTNTVMIADRGFPFWPQLETVDLALIDDIPTVLEVFNAICANFSIGRVTMAEEFVQHNSAATRQAFATALGNTPCEYLEHTQLKKLVPHAIGVIRTGDTTQYANMIIESA